MLIALRLTSSDEIESLFNMKGERRRPTSVCCFPPSTDSNNTTTESATDRSNNRCRFACGYLQDSDTQCCGVLNDSTQHKMVIKSGPHGLHAIASQDIKAGCVILQCLPLAHSVLVPPGGMMEDNEEDEDDDGSRRKKICSRCFIQEGDINIDSSSENARKKKFGRCSKCRMVYYCSRSCQVCTKVQVHTSHDLVIFLHIDVFLFVYTQIMICLNITFNINVVTRLDRTAQT